ncbi:mitochondrial transcription termination factor 3 isoform X1 [Leptinotarsa decemlineata]|uniref:mitochondrial transcription termination factor 3 isoform X1 n=1 Tax=Leptinotarsa decemlineata TaxID=7539 RepID=UPI003D308AE6
MFRKITNCAVLANKSNLKCLFQKFSNTVPDSLIESTSTCSQINEQKSLSVTAQILALKKENYDTSVSKKNTEVSDSVLEKPRRTKVSDLSKYLRPGAVTSLYINKSDSLQELLKLGVKFYEIEKNPEAITFILSLKFEDYRDHILFLKDLKVSTEKIGEIITKNPFLLREHLDDLRVRINYLQFKKFTDDMIVRIVEINAMWLSHSTSDIDKRLGFFQRNLFLTGDQVRQLAAKSPKLVTWPLAKVKVNIFALKEEMGFSKEELQKIVLDKPKLLRMDQNKILRTFTYLHTTMKIPLEWIVEMPDILTCRQKRLMQRHLFLEKLNRAQYNPKEPKYIALTNLVYGTDSEFSTEIAKSSVEVFNAFLKTL